ncbi:hypothetical protein O181_093742, partial [Austropuccinia psidii MF-1]|nr:hypothetical protein [Austropuccinia psidii MF-1]
LDQYSLFVPRLWKSSPNGSATCTQSASPVGKRHEEQSLTEPTGVEPLLSKKPIIPTSTKQAEPSHLSLPMSSALEALSRLKSSYIEQGPDFMTPPAGWTLVAEKGTSSVYKKIVSQISSVFPVYRTDQVIEGVTAEEMVTALAAVSMRPLWDDRIETSSLLESFGNGCTTHLLTTKARFPFQARLLKTANVHAMIQIPSSSINCGSNHTIHFVAAASFPKSDTLSFNYHKLNPQGLVEARMLLEGWIMETLDPYSSSSHEIPSTRCTYFNSIDYGGSIPVAFNSLLDSSLPRVIKAMAQLIKSPGPLPKLCRPIFGLRMDDSLGAHEFDDWKWKLSEPECSSVVVSIDATHQMDFQAIFLVQKGANEISFNNSPTSVNGSVGSTNTQPTPRHENVRQLGVSPPLVDSHNVAGSSTFVRRLVSTPELNPKLSAGQLRRAAASGLHLTESKAPDMIVAELSLNRKSYPNGCRILWKLNFFKEKASMVLDQEIKFPDSPEADTMMVPIEVTIHEMPSPTVFAASLDPAIRRENLLLRMTLPAGSVHSPIKDPLTANSEVDAKAPPLWYSQMSKRHAAVHLRIEQIEIDKDDDKTLDEVKDLNQSKKTRRKSFNISVNGQEKKVIPIWDSQIALGRWEASDYIGPCRWLSRVNRLGKVITSKQKTLITSSITNHDLLPAELRRPCGISPDLFKESEDLSLSAPTPGSINQSPHPSSPVNEVGESEVVGTKNQDGLTIW